MSQSLSVISDGFGEKRTRVDKGSVRLTERDVASLTWIGEQYAIRLDQLARLLGRSAGRTLTESTTRAAVQRWNRAGFAKARKVTVREPGFVWLSSRGLREVGMSFKAWEPSASTASHVYWTNQVRLYVEDRHPEFDWRSERHMRVGLGMQTISDASSHISDGELRTQDAVVGIEVELTSKSTSRRSTIMEALAGRYTTVWYFAPPTVLDCLRRTAESMPASVRERVRLYGLDKVA